MPAPRPAPRYRSHTIEADVPLHVVDFPGEGRPLLLLHGIGMDWRVWQATVRRLRPAFHVHALDLRGHGSSGKPPHGYTLAHYAADVEDVVDRLDLTDLVLVGSSLGGAVAVAVEAPDDIVSRRILVDPPLTGGPVRDPAQFEDILRLKHQPPGRLADYLAGDNPGASRFLLETMSAMWNNAADGVIEDLLADRDSYFDLDSSLAALTAPTLLMRADPQAGGVLGDDEAQRTLTLLPNGSLVFVPGAGHAIHATRPADFARLVLDFSRSPAPI